MVDFLSLKDIKQMELLALVSPQIKPHIDSKISLSGSLVIDTKKKELIVNILFHFFRFLAWNSQFSSKLTMFWIFGGLFYVWEDVGVPKVSCIELFQSQQRTKV